MLLFPGVKDLWLLLVDQCLCNNELEALRLRAVVSDEESLALDIVEKKSLFQYNGFVSR